MQGLNHIITMKQYIGEKEYKEINQLQEIIILKDKVNLKLELDFKLEIQNNSEASKKRINEFLYYVDDVLVAYLGISCFGGNIAELNGMTHPEWRRNGIFKKLFNIAKDECCKSGFKKILLLSDGKSKSGNEFIKAVGGKYDFSEYGMELLNEYSLVNLLPVKLRKAEASDQKELSRQDLIYFSDKEENKNFGVSNEGQTEPFEEDEFRIKNAYMAELGNEVIGKIHIEYSDDSAFILGFGILPEFRGKGYGKVALKEALKLIREKNIKKVGLDVAAKNSRALNLYKSCGFEEKSVMNYFI
jgi:ribosomal protein S18 acetylase RimI-like enzyme